MGSVNSTGSKLEKALASDLPEDERYFGLENFGNTCYCNSVLQALYFCEPFRNAVLLYAHNRRLHHNSPTPYANPPTSIPTQPSAASSSLSPSSNHGPHQQSNASTAPVPNGPTANSHPSSASTFRNAVKGVVNVYSSGSSAAATSTAAPLSSTIPQSSQTPANIIASTAIPNAANTPIPAPADIERPPSEDDTMLTALADLFSNIASQKKRTGSVPPKSFVTKLRQENELFSSYMHQDAHEFLNFILNNIVECLNREAAGQKRQHEQYQKQQQLQQLQQRNLNQTCQSNSPTNHVTYQDQYTANSIIGAYPSSSPAMSPAKSPYPKTNQPTSSSHTPSNAHVHDASNGQNAPNGSMYPSSSYSVPYPSPSSSSSSSSAVAAGKTLAPEAEAEAGSGSGSGLGPSPVSMTAGGVSARGFTANGHDSENRTFVHELFEGELSNEVRCLCCETVTQRVESFFDLSVDVEQNSSLTACLRSFSSTELLQKQDKFFCDACCSLQEAERRMRVKRLPRILALHLKRFKYVEHLGKYKKLSYRVVFPLELRLCNTSDDAHDPDRLYSLFAVVVHVGSGPNQGHYVSLIKSHGQWLLFDDDCVEPKDESEIQSVYGITQESGQSTEAGYILFYEQTSS